MRKTLKSAAIAAGAACLVLALPGTASAATANVSNAYGKATLYTNDETGQAALVVLDTHETDGKAVGAELQVWTGLAWINSEVDACWDSGDRGSPGITQAYPIRSVVGHHFNNGVGHLRVRFHGSKGTAEYGVSYSPSVRVLE